MLPHVRRGTVNSNTNNIVHKSTESSYESPSKDLDLAREPWMHHFNTTAAGKASSFTERKVVPQTCCWDILLKTKMRYNSWWPKIKLLCKMTLKELGNDLIFLPSESTKWYFFPTILCYCTTLDNCWGKMCKDAKIKKCCKCDESLCSNKEIFLSFPYSCSVLRYENFLNNFFLPSNKVIYMTNFGGQMIVFIL